MTLVYSWKNYQINLSQLADSVVVQLLELDMCKLYSCTFVDTMIINYCPNQNIFYTVLKTSFESWEKADMEKATVDIILNNAKAIVKITHKFYVNFTFDLVLNCNVDNNLDAKDLLIKKLEKKIGELEKSFNKNIQELTVFKNFVDEHMELNIVDKYVLHNHGVAQSPTLMRVNTPELVLSIGYKSQSCYTAVPFVITNLDSQVSCQINNQTKFNKNFKLIYCKKLTINFYHGHDFEFENIPQSIETLCIKEANSQNFINSLSKLNLPNLHTICLDSCGNVNIYASIAHLKVKRVQLINMGSFTETGILKSNGIEVI
jgi:hypothetical protein